MTYDFFKEHYDFNEYEVKRIYIKDNTLYINVVMPIYLELIANGYRPEMNMTQEKTFKFNVNYKDKKYTKNVRVEFTDNSIKINDVNVPLSDFKVDIE